MHNIILLCFFIFLLRDGLAQNTTTTNSGNEYWFNPENVNVLYDNVPVSGTIIAYFQYSDYYIVSIPDNAKQVTYRLSHTNYGASCDVSIRAGVSWDYWEIQFPDGWTDFSTTSSANYTIGGTSDNGSFFPGKTQYVIISTGTELYNCSYTLEVDIETCGDNAVLFITDSGNGCLDITESLTISGSSGSPTTYQGTLSSSSDTDLYRTIVETMNVSRLVFQLDSADSNVIAVMACGYATTSSDYNVWWYKTENQVYNATTGLYSSFIDYPGVEEDTICNQMFAVYSTNSSSFPVSYSVTFSWSACTNNLAGWSLYGSSQDCTHSIAYPDLDLLSAGTGDYLITLPPSTHSTDGEYSYSYLYMNIPYSTVGTVSLNCSATDSSAVSLLLSKYTMPDCHHGAWDVISCNGALYTQWSHHLYMSGEWYFVACSSSDQAVSVTLSVVSNAYVSNIGPSPSPSASPTPASVSSSPSPQADNDSSSDSSQLMISAAIILLVIVLN